MRTETYMEDEDKLLCEAWMEIGQDPQMGAEQKGSTFRKRGHAFFHEYKKFEPYKFESDRVMCHLKRGGASSYWSATNFVAPMNMWFAAREWHWCQGLGMSSIPLFT